MDTKYIPGGGAKFSLVKFSDRLRGAAKYGPLRSSQDNIMKVVRAASGKIRGGDFDSAAALKKFQSLDKEASREAVHAAGKIFKHLGESAGPIKSSPVASQEKDALKPKPHIAVSRDPNFQVDYQGLSVEERDSGRSAIRGEASRAALNYEKMSKLGGSESARNLQKDAFNKLQQTGGGLIKRR
jgi:hypothetical protein